MVFLAVFFFSVVFAGRDYFAFPTIQLYYDEVQLHKVDPVNCQHLYPITKKKDSRFYSSTVIAVDNKRGLVYTIGLLKNDSQPAGPFNPHLIGFKMDGGDEFLDYPLNDLEPQYLGIGMASFGIQCDEDSGHVYIIARAPGTEDHHLFDIDPVAKTTKDLQKLFDSELLQSYAYDPEKKLLYVGHKEDIFVYDMNKGGEFVKSFKNKYYLMTMHYDPQTKNIYGVGGDYNPSWDRHLVYFDGNGKFTDLGVVDDGFPDGTRLSAMDPIERTYFVELVISSHPHQASYYLIGVNMDDASTVSKCLLNGIDNMCCNSIAFSTVKP